MNKENECIKFVEIYEQNLEKASDKDVEISAFSSKPIMNNNLLSPKSGICVLPIFNINFFLDKVGMKEILENFQNKWDLSSSKEKKNLVNVLYSVYTVVDDYLGGHGNFDIRKGAYLNSENHSLTLSEIKGKKIGLCAERATVGHEILKVLEKSHLFNYESFLVNSNLKIDSNEEPHSFIILKNKSDSSKQYLFDIENPIRFKNKNSDQVQYGLALYSMTSEEYNEFLLGKSVSLKSIYEQVGMEVVDEKRYYGNGQEKENLKKENDIDRN